MVRIWEKYQVSYKDYFKGLENGMLAKLSAVKDNPLLDEVEGRIHSFSKNVKYVKVPIQQLVQKYQIKNKKILSIGPAVGSEEYWFWDNGNSLTFIDIDQGNVIEPFLKVLPQKTSDCLTYYIGNAYDYSDNKFQGRFDVCYCSSFAPDELRRKEILKEYSRFNLNVFIARVIRKLIKVLKIKKYIRIENWPKNENPIMDLIINYVDEYLEMGGIFIQQEYGYPIDFRSNPHAIVLIKRQLDKIGVQLLRIYSFKEKYLSNLIVGYRGTREDALAFLETIKPVPDINIFHGRSEYGRDGGEIVVTFDLMTTHL